jgi:cytoskeletal protein CcmA (bactofilin family)
MWEKLTQPEPAKPTSAHQPAHPPGISAPIMTPAEARAAGNTARTTARLGPNLQIKGEITGNEDLHIDGHVEGTVSLGGHRLTVGHGAELTAEVVAREVVVYGKVTGDLRARDRIEIRKDGSVVGDLTTARISIEDGAYVKGIVEIDRSNTQVGADLESLLARGANKPTKPTP